MSRSRKQPYVYVACHPESARAAMKRHYNRSFRRETRQAIASEMDPPTAYKLHKEVWDLPGECRVWWGDDRAKRK